MRSKVKEQHSRTDFNKTFLVQLIRCSDNSTLNFPNRQRTTLMNAIMTWLADNV
jgi:hypothetical protein